MRHGFTLIELIVVIALISIFTGVGYSAYTLNIQSKELDRQVDAFTNVLTLTRQRAISRDTSHGATCSNFGGYLVLVRPSTHQYLQRFICSGPPVTYTSQGSWFPMGDIEFKTPTSDLNIQFLHPYGCTNAACNLADQTVTFKNPATNTCKSIIINKLGNITIGDAFTSGC